MAGAPKILPEPGKKNILVTSALPYVNNVPHLGNIIGSVLSADVFARYSKLRDRPTLFICGTDEYGTATEVKAYDDGKDPKALCDEFHAKHKSAYDWFEIGFDHFGRTTNEQHKVIVQDIFKKLYRNDFFSRKVSNQTFCIPEEPEEGETLIDGKGHFLADRHVTGTCPKCQYDDARGDQCDQCGSLITPEELINPQCRKHSKAKKKHEISRRDTEHIYIKLDALQDNIKKWFEKSSSEGGWPQNGISITKSWLDKGLQERSITRDLKWGVELPTDLGLPEDFKNKVIYVWFDACIGYPSITADYFQPDPAIKDDRWEKWWRDPENVKLYQFMGKDNVPFHTVIFPGTQIGTGDPWTQLNHLSTTEYLNYENDKFSKSRGKGVFGDQAQVTGLSPSVWRYYLLSNRPETGDTQFIWSDFAAANNNELIKTFGNFVNRYIKFVHNNLDGIVPEFSATYTDDTFDFPNWLSEVNKLLGEYNDLMENVHLRQGVKKIMEICSLGNLLATQRLDMASLNEHADRTKTIIGLGLNLCSLVASISSPYMPSTATGIVQQLNIPLVSITDTFDTNAIKSGHKIGKPFHLFSNIKDSQMEAWKKHFKGSDEVKTEEQLRLEKEKEERKKRDKEKKKAKKQQKKDDQAAEAGQVPKMDGSVKSLPIRKKPEEPSSSAPAATE